MSGRVGKRSAPIGLLLPAPPFPRGGPGPGRERSEHARNDHRHRPGVCYPATFASTADHDDRVVLSPRLASSTAALQAGQTCSHPILIDVETEASHG